MEDSEELYIKIENGKPVGHPITGWNLRNAYPNLEPEKLPPGFERFTRVDVPQLSIFEKHIGTEYIKSNYGWTDNHIVEKNDPVISDIESLIEDVNYPEMPNDGQQYFWSISAGKWINQKVFDQVFLEFLKKNKIKYENIEFKTLEEMHKLSDEQKRKFGELIEEYNKIVNEV